MNTSSARLCSNHFQEDDYSNFGESSAKRIRLKKNAVPSIFSEYADFVFLNFLLATLTQFFLVTVLIFCFFFFRSSSLEVKEKDLENRKKEYGHYCMVCKKRTHLSTRRYCEFIFRKCSISEAGITTVVNNCVEKFLCLYDEGYQLIQMKLIDGYNFSSLILALKRIFEYVRNILKPLRKIFI